MLKCMLFQTTPFGTGNTTKSVVITSKPSDVRKIEDKLKISSYLDWTFVSCSGPMKVKYTHIGVVLVYSVGFAKT